MINESNKEAILNGACGISRGGHKCRYIGKSGNSEFPYQIVYYTPNDIIRDIANLSEQFRYLKNSEDGLDVIGLWETKVEPFNLDKALEGHPVKLRNGLKAYVKYCLPPDFNGIYPVQGYIIKPGHTPNMEIQRWNLKGKYWTTDSCEELFPYDIISMWEEDEPEADKDS
ncbi:hypothetical protein P9Z71_11455 [Glaesserella parasuis]|uniref:hypothetical protein n=1 Tax=Glaesserella parasuis TaxID=738 RepID=UPI002436D7E0|nr:hypothetical protein [Glaesserella parasuis]MDG6310815.1 hypothetical protein [Glaesserella parasuis]